MNELQIFNNQKFGAIRTITENGKTLFCGKDVASALGYKRAADAITAHCKGSVIRRLPTPGGEQDAKFIPEGDIYRLAAKSELPGADEFESWIFDEVLPSIRSTAVFIQHIFSVALTKNCEKENVKWQILQKSSRNTPEKMETSRQRLSKRLLQLSATPLGTSM